MVMGFPCEEPRLQCVATPFYGDVRTFFGVRGLGLEAIEYESCICSVSISCSTLNPNMFSQPSHVLSVSGVLVWASTVPRNPKLRSPVWHPETSS